MNVIISNLNMPHHRDGVIRFIKDKKIIVKLWIGFDEGSGHFDGVDIYPAFQIESSFLSGSDKNKCICPKHVYDEIYKYFITYVRVQERWECTIEPYNYTQKFSILTNSIYEYLFDHRIDLIIFGAIPHAGFDYLWYVVAKAMGIKTVAFLDLACFPGKVMPCLSIERYGFLDLKHNGEWRKVDIPRQFYKELSYTSDYHEKKPVLYTPYNEIKMPTIIMSILKRKYISSNYKISFYNLIERLSYKFIQLSLKKKYLKERFFYDYYSPKTEDKYVYFPLHLQPELCTECLGGIYDDQLLAVERLSAILPDGWKIYVKDYPKQSYYKRGKLFWDRLSKIKSVCIVANYIDTYELMTSCQFVAAISGTAGYEAISGGKNVLLFGYAWYRTLPGVFTYEENMNINDVIKYEINHEELAQAVNELVSRCFDGRFDNLCVNELSVEEIKTNNDKVYSTLCEIIELLK